MNLREVAKQWRLLFWINSKLKCYKLKRDWSRIKREYEAKADASDFSYDANRAIEEFKRRHKLYQPNYVATPMGSLRVFWLGTNKDQDESGFLQALSRLGKVTVFHNVEGDYGIWSGSTAIPRPSTFEEIRKINDELLLKQIMEAHAGGGVDVFVGQMWASRLSKEVLGKIQKMGIPVINISMDDRLPVHWTSQGNVQLGSVGLASNTDIVLTTSPETCLWFGLEGCPALYWPLASDPLVFAPKLGELRDIDVLFIGNKYGARGQIVRYLENHGVKVDCYGGGWPNGHISASKMAELSKRARIILGVGSVGHCDDVYTLKLRDFDAPMSGALYLTHRNPDLCEMYIDGEEVAYYKTPKEALNKIRFYLQHPNEMLRVASNGHKKALSRDTWDQRLSTTFEQLGLLQPKKFKSF